MKWGNGKMSLDFIHGVGREEEQITLRTTEKDIQNIILSLPKFDKI